MADMNSVCVTGNLTRDPELKTTSGGLSICDLGIAVNTSIKRDGQWEEKGNFLNVTVFGKQGENCAQYLAKGRKVGIEGRLDYQSWEKDGQKRSTIKIIADSVTFLSPKGENSGSGSGGGSRPASNGGDEFSEGWGPDSAPAPGSVDEDIPF